MKCDTELFICLQVELNSPMIGLVRNMATIVWLQQYGRDDVMCKRSTNQTRTRAKETKNHSFLPRVNPSPILP